MKKNLFTLIAFMLLFTSCITINNCYLCETAEPIRIYSTKDLHSSYFDVPAGRNLIAAEKYKKYRRVKYGDHSGYVYKIKFYNERIINEYDLANLVFNTSTSRYEKRSSDSESTYNSSSYSGGTVHVKGYYRKNGTYVRSYTRRAPSRRR